MMAGGIMTMLSAISLLSAACALMLGVIILQKQPRSAAQVVYLLLSLVISFVAFTEFGFRQAETESSALFWLKASEAAPLIVSLIALFTGLYTKNRFFRNIPAAVAAVVLPALFFWESDLSTSALSGHPVMTHWGWGQSIPHTLFFHCYSAWAAILLTLSALMIIRYYIRHRGSAEHGQAKYVALAISFVVFVTLIIDTGMNYLHVQLPEYATLAYAIANTLIAYAIWRHQLFVFNPVVAAETILETMSDALFLVLPDGIIAHVNSAARRMFGISGGEFHGRTLDRYIKTASPLLHRHGIAEVYAADQVSDVDAVTADMTKETPKMLSVAARTVKDGSGSVLGSVVTVRDVTDRVQIEQALRESHELLEERVKQRTEELHHSNRTLAAERERLAVTLRSIGDGVITTDTEGCVTFINKIGETITGWPLQDALGEPAITVLDLYTKNDPGTVLNPVGDVLHYGVRRELVSGARLVTRKGDIRSIDDSAAPIYSDDRQLLGVVIVFRDITEKEKLEEELLRVKRLESVALLAGGIAHDFNNLLTGISNILFMGKTAASRPEEVVATINSAEMEIYRAKRLAMQLLTFAQGGEPVTTVCSPRTIVEESVGFFLSGSKCSYELDFDENLMNVTVDRGMIEQVLSNLVINAEQAMADGGVIHVTVGNVVTGNVSDASTSAAASLLSPGTYVRLTVTDQGGGIPEEIRDRIFDPFFSTKGHGRGLGLSIARSIVNKHGGTIAIDTTGPSGTSISVYLPAAEQSAPDQLTVAERSDNAFQDVFGYKILLLDDEEVIRTTTAKILSLKGYQVVTAEDGEQAVELYREACSSGYLFDLVILDLTIPGGIGGKECLEHLKLIDPNVVAIVSSGYSNDDVMAKYEEYGFSGVLRKPYDVSRLYETVQMVLEAHNA